MTDFKAGDVVVLKTGGKEMKVANIDEQNLVWCVWEYPAGIESRRGFKPDLLMGSGGGNSD